MLKVKLILNLNSKIMDKIKNLLNVVFRFICKWSELVTIPIALILWWLSPLILRGLDSTAATYDAGIFQAILFAIIAFFILIGVVWIYMKISFPKVYKFLDQAFGKNLDPEQADISFSKYTNLTLWQKSVLVLWLFSLLSVCIVLLMPKI